MVTSVPGRVVPRQLTPFDKIAHFTLYGVFAVLLSRDIAPLAGRWRATLVAFAIAATFGAFDEWHQGFIPGRARELADWRADLFGAASGALLFALYQQSRRSARTATAR